MKNIGIGPKKSYRSISRCDSYRIEYVWLFLVKEDPLLVVLGQEVMDSLEELPHISQVDLTYIETMWFDLGKKPILRLVIHISRKRLMK